MMSFEQPQPGDATPHDAPRLGGQATLPIAVSFHPCFAAAALAFAFCCIPARAQEPLSCSLGTVKERVAPQYPVQLQGRILEGTVQLLATFAPDGRVTGSKILSGPQALRFAADSYVHGWRAEPSDAPRQCSIAMDFRFDGSQAACNARTEVHARAERLDDTHVLVHLSCDIW